MAGLGTLFKYGKKPVMAVGRAIWQGGMRRMAVGAGVGAIAGYAGSDSNIAENRLGSAFKGAMLGAGIAGAPSGIMKIKNSPSARSFIGKSLTRGGKDLFSGAMSAGRGALKAGDFALRHSTPLGLAGIGIAGASGFAGRNDNQTLSSPTLSGARVNTNYGQQEYTAAGMRSGTGMAGTGRIGSIQSMSQPMRRAMRDSTGGLVQGLHRGRHS